MDAGCQLDSIERVGVVGWGIRNVCDHGGSAVDVAQGLPEQHGQFAVPAEQKKYIIIIRKCHCNIQKEAVTKYMIIVCTQYTLYLCNIAVSHMTHI